MINNFINRVELYTVFFLSLTAIPVNAGAPAELVGKWDLQTIHGKEVLEDGETMLEFNDEGRMAARAGCNSIMSSYELAKDGISFGQGATTMMACPEPLMEQEQKFIKAMETVSDYRFDGDAVNFLDASGNVMFSAVRDE